MLHAQLDKRHRFCHYTPCFKSGEAMPKGPLDPVDSRRNPDEAESKRLDHYITIGQTLTGLERSRIMVGIPFVNICDVCLRVGPTQNTIGGYLKESLVTVPTNSLELYAQDLESLDDSCESYKQLNFSDYIFWRRYLSAFLVAVIICLLVLNYAWLFLGVRSISVFFLAAFFGAVCGGLVSYRCREQSRRRSFGNVLWVEICRRRGIDIGPTTRVRVYPLSESTG